MNSFVCVFGVEDNNHSQQASSNNNIKFPTKQLLMTVTSGHENLLRKHITSSQPVGWE